MYLTPEEQKMCEGAQGEVVAEAMNNLIKLGEAFGGHHGRHFRYFLP